MATSRATSRRSPVGWFFLAAGVLYLLNILLAHVAPKLSSPWWDFFAYALLAIAFVLVFLWKVSTILRVAFIVAAVGWALLAIGTVASLGSSIATIATILALVGTLVAGILMIVRHTFGRLADLVFLITAILAALLLGHSWLTFISGAVETVIAILFGIGLVISGFLIARRR
jgi:hypothetical protein